MFDKYIFIEVDKLGEHEFLRLLLSIRCKIVVGFLFYGFNATNRGKHVIIHTWNMCRLDTKYACNHNLIPAHIHTLKWMRINHIWCVCVCAQMHVTNAVYRISDGLIFPFHLPLTYGSFFFVSLLYFFAVPPLQQKENRLLQQQAFVFCSF